MSLLELYARRKEALAGIGEAVCAEARTTGTTFSYVDPDYGDGIVREYPDGRRELIKGDGSIVPIPPKLR